ncbi:bifunctional 2',3'-cyclic-nucleotide 2'-phosphodiesterase/3'-nucleotidase [Flavimaricola marinus]|uniref:Trifunctional nucleotide phosphoesterase protein YfkN n=1 Tax=Flavimaricola marinus TaxID=1819565 RepID=A0A238LAW9_9RHOB|nr:bifunctional 2',3'-cyclic-nucleotide 2'-phosphodiesterase/3'-nucleotidase [Flavimaricola marinus]SMY06741.1 Trifunctional nucleotide phosphoesterase protein YfkN precursor [Flavimaricola marinus]
MSHKYLPDWTLSRRQTHLRILATTDLHLNVMPYDYFADRALAASGLARTAKLISELRQIDGTCLLFDNGDFLQGNPLSDWMARDSGFAFGDLHPMVAAMNAIGYDGGTLGNHDFNYGLVFLRNALAKADFPVVSANMTLSQCDCPAQDKTLQPPWAILPREVTTGDGRTQVLKVGIIGFAPPQTPIWEQFSLGSHIGSRDIVLAARSHVPHLRAAGADIVVALAHTGVGNGGEEPGQENAGLALADVPGIDAVITGHTHQVFPGPGFEGHPDIDPVAGTLCGKPAVMAGSLGSHVGVIDLKLEKDGDGWSVSAFQVATPALEARTDGELDEKVVASVKEAHDQVVSLMQEPIGSTDVRLHSYLSLVGHAPASTVLADAMRTRAKALLADTRWQETPMAVAVAPSRSGGVAGAGNYVDIAPGPLLRRHAAELYHYPNTLCILALNGAQIRDWLEWSARLFLPIRPGIQDQDLIDPTMAGYNFDTLFGLRYEIDPSQPAAVSAQDGGGRRISNLRTADGGAITDDDTILLAVNNFRASGGGGYAMARPDQIVLTTDLALRDITKDHLSSEPVRVACDAVWTFRTLPGTSALFETSELARSHLTEAPFCRIEDAGPGNGGFHRFRLRF